MTDQLRKLGFEVVDSQANFVWATRTDGDHQRIYEALQQQRILIRYMRFPDRDSTGNELEGLRITVGTDEEVDHFLETLKGIL